MNSSSSRPKKVTLFWNHICILHNYEKTYLAQVQHDLLEEGVELEIKYFGLGYDEHMSTYLARDEAELPDIIISADLEVFEAPRVFEKLGPLHKCESWNVLKDSMITQSIRRHEALLPLVIIPLTIYGQQKVTNKPLSEFIEKDKFAFGGINNSAAKVIVKAIWERYGKEAAKKALRNSEVFDLPIMAFNAARKGLADYALVPSIYSLRANDLDSHCGVPAEGPALLPSYLCARKSIDEDLARLVSQKILSEELMEFYASKGDLIICLDNKSAIESTQEHAVEFLTASQSFLGFLSSDEFYELYKKYLPTAKVI